MFKSIKAGAVAAVAAVSLFVAVPTTHAAWDYFEVIEEGSAEAKVSSDGELKIRFGIIPNLEIMATNVSPFGMYSDLSVGARYQVLPEMLAVGVDFGIPTESDQNIGLAPSLQFHMGINDMISLGAGVGLGIDINSMTEDGIYHGDPDETEMYMNLEFGLEVGFQLTENFGLWVGADFAQDLTLEDADMVIVPGFGISYNVANITVGVDFGLDLYRTNREGEEDQLGLTGGVNFAIAF